MVKLISDKLNGELKAEQNTNITRPENFFATNEPIHLRALISDKLKILNASYTWHLDNKTIEENTTKPNYTWTFYSNGEKYIGVKTQIIANVFDGPIIGSDTVKKIGDLKVFMYLKGKKVDCSLLFCQFVTVAKVQ